MGVPFRIGVMQLTMEPLEEILAHARALDRHGFDTIWLAEAYPWWRKHSMEARSATAISALIARETERLTIGWGIISPFTRHPIAGRDGRARDAGGRRSRPLPPRLRRLADLHEGDRRRRRQAAEPARATRCGSCAACSAASRSTTTARRSAPTCPALAADAQCAARRRSRSTSPATGPRMQEYAGEEADGLLTASITTPDVRPLQPRQHGAGRRQGRARPGGDRRRLHDRRLDRRTTAPPAARARARSPACTSPTRCRTSRARPTCCSSWPGSRRQQIAPIAEAMERGGRARRGGGGHATRSSTAASRSRARPADCIAAIEAYREAGCTHVMLELWGEDRERQIELFATEVLPHLDR